MRPSSLSSQTNWEFSLTLPTTTSVLTNTLLYLVRGHFDWDCKMVNVDKTFVMTEISCCRGFYEGRRGDL